jgi:hypothetical protein
MDGRSFKRSTLFGNVGIEFLKCPLVCEGPSGEASRQNQVTVSSVDELWQLECP